MNRLDFLAFALTLFVTPALAFENKCTHPKLTGKASVLLTTSQLGNYGESLFFISETETGADKEDELGTLPFLNHFYNPATLQPLNASGLSAIAGQSFLETALARAHRYWVQAVSDYKIDHKPDAFFELGRAIHLLQDMNQPGHTHNDPHVPPPEDLTSHSASALLRAFNITTDILLSQVVPNAPDPTSYGSDSLDGHAQSVLEKKVEAGCQTNTLVFPSGGTLALPPGQLGSEPDSQFMSSAARETYLETSFPGSINAFDPNNSVQVLGNSVDAKLVPPDRNPLDSCRSHQHWLLTDFDAQKSLCFDPLVFEAGTVTQGFNQEWWQIKNTALQTVVSSSGQYFYIKRYDQVTDGSGTTLLDHLITTRLARSVEWSAGYIKLFDSIVDPILPSIDELRLTDSAGNIFQAGETISADTVYVKVHDPTDAEHPTPSGIYTISLKGAGSGYSQSFSFDPTSPSGNISAAATFTGLPNDRFTLTVFDGTGNFQTTTFSVNTAPSASIPPIPPGPQPPGPQPNPPPSGPTSSPTGGVGLVCATDFAHKINGAQVVDQGNTYSYPYSPAADTVCYSYACSRAGTYSILVQFQNTLGNLGPVQTINCVDHTPQCRVCSGPNCSQSISCGPGDIDVATAQLGFRLSEDVLNGSPAIYGSPDACQQLEFIAGGICHDLPAGGGVWWDRTYAPPAHSVTGFFSYQPPPGKRRDQEFTATASLNGSALSIVTYPNHGTYSLHIEMPNMGQPQLSCNQTNTCVASPGGGGGGGGGPGGGMPPPPQVQPQTPTTINAARSQGLFPLSGLISAFTNIIAPGGYTLSGNFPPPPSVVNLATAKICTQDESTSLWSCLSQAASSLSVGCASGSCNFSANIPHFSTWVVFADYPNSLPDLTAPALAGLQIGPDGQNWAAPGTVQNSSISFVRATVTDPSVGNEIRSGVLASTTPVAASTEAATMALFHFDESSGTVAYDSSGHAVSSAVMVGSQQTWVAGRFGSALNFNGNDQYLSLDPFNAAYDALGTVGVWVYPNGSDVSGGILTKTGVIIYTSHNHVRANVTGTPTAILADAGVLIPNAWNYIAVTSDGEVARLFVNGALKAAAPSIYGVTEAQGYIGRAAGISGQWSGAIDEVKFLSRTESPEEIALDYRNGNTLLYTTDNGLSWTTAANIDFGGAVDGQPGPYTLTASSLTLARSTYTNHAEFVVRDVAGNISSTTIDLPVATPDVTAPAFSKVQVSTTGVDWYALGTILPASSATVRLSVKDPAVPPAYTSGLVVSTQPSPAILTAGTIALWHLDESTGSVAHDATGGYDMTVNPAGWAGGKFGAGLSFNSDYGAAPAFLTGQHWTLSFWIKQDSWSDGYMITKFSDPHAGFAILGSGSKLYALIGSANQTYLPAPAPLSLGEWHYAAVTYDGTVGRFYIDGVVVAQQTASYQTDGGGFSIGNALHGSLDEVRFLDHAASDAQIASEYRSGYGALFSADGGQTWMQTSAAYGATAPGAAYAKLTVTGLPLAASTTSNLLVTFATDMEGNFSSSTFVLPAGVDATVPGTPVVVSTTLASNGAVKLTWVDTSTQPAASYALYGASVPFSSVAGMTPLQTSTRPCTFDLSSVNDVFYYSIVAQTVQGNAGAPSPVTQVVFDHQAPHTALSVAGSTAAAATGFYASAASTFTLVAVDTGAVATGVAAVSLSVDGSTVAFATAPFHLTEGVHLLAYSARDAVGNIEAVNFSTVAVDGTPAVSTAHASGASAVDVYGRIVIDNFETVLLSAADPTVSSVTSGLAALYYRVDASSYALSTGPVTLPEGVHQVSFYAVDGVSNAESPNTATFVVAVPAVTGVAISTNDGYSSLNLSWTALSGAEGYVAQISTNSDFNTVVNATATETTSVAFTHLQPLTAYYARVSAFTQTNSGLFSSVVSTGTGQAPPDALPPRTNLFADGPSFGASPLYATDQTTFSVIAVDDRVVIGDETGVGVAQTFVAVDTSAYGLYGGTFTLATEGSHTIGLYSVDLSSHAETAGAVSVAIDLTAPVTQLAVNGSTVSISAPIVVSSGTPITLPAADPVSNGVASGLATTFFVVDANPFDSACLAVPYDPGQPAGTCANEVYGGAFNLAPGTHSVYYFSEDNVGNQEALHISSFTMYPTVTWSGAGGDGNWLTAANWSTNRIPSANDAIIIAANTTVSATTSAISFRRLTLGDISGSSTPRLIVSGPVVSGGDVTINNAAVLEQSSTNHLAISGSVTVKSGARLTHSQNSDSFAYGLDLGVSGDFILESGASINAAGLGFAATQGPGAGGGCGYGPAGGGHGGQGGQGGGGCSAIGPANDSLSSPKLPGSGGASASFASGGSGGGSVVITAGGTMTLNGLIDANGSGAVNGGGGAGGSINLTATVLNGNGTLQANGGTVSNYGGGGGGGRIAVTVLSSDGSSLALLASGGGGVLSQSGGGGTSYIKRPGQTNFNLSIGGIYAPSQPQGPTPISFPLVVDTFSVINAAIVSTTTLQPITVNSSITLAGSYSVTATTLTFPTAGLSGFAIPVGAKIHANAMSFDPGWAWTVAGSLALDNLTATSFATSGDTNISSLTITGSSPVNIPNGASLTVGALTSTPGLIWTVDGTLTANALSAARVNGGGIVTISTLTLTDASPITIPPGASLSATTIVAPTGLSWTVNGRLATSSLAPSSLTGSGTVNIDTLTTSGSVVLQSGALLTPYSAYAPMMIINTGGDFTLASSATLSLVGRGFAPAMGPGAGGGCAYGPAGAGHGGQGGQGPGGCSLFGPANDSISDPLLPGSGGDAAFGQPGGSGGGALRLSANGTITVNGLIDASGLGVSDGGGGAGGAINLTAQTLTGSGTLKANGGSVTHYGSGGGGGRIAISASLADTSSFNFQTSGGLGASAQSGGGGTAYQKKPGQTAYNLYVGGSDFVAASQPQGITPVSVPLSVDTITVSNASIISTTTLQPIIVNSSMTLSGAISIVVSSLTLPAPGLAGLTVPVGSTISVAASFSKATSSTSVHGNPELVFTAPITNSSILVPSSSTSGVVALASAQTRGLAAVSNLYDLGPENTVFSPQATLVFSFDPASLAAQGISTGTLGVYDYSVSLSTWIYLGGVVDTVNGTVTVQVQSLSSIVGLLRRTDSTPPALALAPVNQSTMTIATPLMTAVYSDTGTGVNAASVRLTVDFVDVTTQAVISASSASFTPTAALTQSSHSFSAVVVDFAGNTSTASTIFFLDSIPPLLSLTPPNGSTTATLSSISVSYNDAGSGVSTQSLHLLLDGVDVTTSSIITASSAAYTITASLTQSTHSFTTSLADKVGNSTSTTVVFRFDSLPPSLTLTPVNGSTATTATPLLYAVYADSGTGISTASVHLTLDGVDVTTSAVVTASSATYLPAAGLAQSTHTFAVSVADFAANISSSSVGFRVDSLPPSLTLTPANGSTVTVTAPGLFAVYADSGVGVSTSSVRLSLDGVDVTTSAVVTASSASFTPSVLSQSTHTVTATVADRSGNVASSTASFRVDSIAPVTSLQVDGLTKSATNFVIVSTDSVGFVAVDSGTGVSQTLYALDGSTTSTVFVSTFSLALGTHTVSYRSVDFAGNTEGAKISTITVVQSLPVVSSFTPTFGWAGTSVTIVGVNFGVFTSSKSQVFFGTTTAIVSQWTSTQVIAAVPSLSTGAYALKLSVPQGASTATVTVGTFTVVSPRIASVVPSTAAVGLAMTITGQSFGVFLSTAQTQVLFGGATMQVTVWGDSAIVAGLPIFASSGSIPVTIKRIADNGGTVLSNAVNLAVSSISVTAIAPSSGPIGIPFTLTGSGFGTQAGTSTQVLIGGSTYPVTAPITTWTNTSIVATVPALAIGSQTVVAQRIQGTGVAYGKVQTFRVAALTLATPTPSSGTVASTFTLAGVGFGPFNGANTRLLVAGSTTTVVSWTDTQIIGQVPVSTGGAQGVRIERTAGTGLQSSNTVFFTIITPVVTGVVPSSGPIGTPFTITGTGFGVQSGTNTFVTLNGSTATITVWISTSIKGIVPGGISSGTAAMVVNRVAPGGILQTPATNFLVVIPVISTINPNFGVTGASITVTGTGFGAFVSSAATKVFIGTNSVSVTSWSDTTIRWTVPASANNGLYGLTVVRISTGGSVTSSSMSFTKGNAPLGFAALSANRSSIPLSARPDADFWGDLMITAADGGIVQTPALASVEIPPGALSQDTDVTVARGRSLYPDDRAAALGRLAPAGEPIVFGPDGTSFGSPVTISLPYDPDLVPSGSVSAIAIHYFDPAAKTWTALPTRVDAVNHVVSAQTSHFSLYQPLIPGGFLVAAGALDAFGLRAAYVFPNPARGVTTVTFRIQPGLADSVEVRAYDLSGRRIYSSSDFRFSVLDDGNGLGAQDTYDNAWDLSGVGSGVYTFVITARKSGQSDIHKTGKVGVIK